MGVVVNPVRLLCALDGLFVLIVVLCVFLCLHNCGSLVDLLLIINPAYLNIPAYGDAKTENLH